MKAANKVKELLKKALHTGLGHIFGANAINQIMGFASSFILIRILPKGEFGIYSYAFNIYSFFALANGLGMESASLQVCSERVKTHENADAFLKYSICVGSLFNIFLGFLICAGSLWIPFSMKGVNDILYLFAIMPLVTTIFNSIQTYFRYNLMNEAYAKCSVLNTALILVGSVAGAAYFQASGMILFRELAMAASVAVGILVYRFPIKRVMKAAAISIGEKIDMLKISLISMLNIATGQLLYLIDVFLIGALISDELIVASYKTATIIPNALLFVPSALVIYIYPYFAQKQEDKEWVKQKFFLVTKYFAAVNAAISIGLVIFAPIIVRILFGRQYLDAVPAFRILSVSYFFSASFRKITGNLLVTQRKLHINFWIGILEAAINVLGNWILIHLFGAIGAAITTLVICIVSSAVSVSYFTVYLNKEIKRQKKEEEKERGVTV